MMVAPVGFNRDVLMTWISLRAVVATFPRAAY
jgi:hypothetical protein